jgi:hypothetical protein
MEIAKNVVLERRCSGFASYKVDIIVEILVSRLRWRNLSLRWSLLIMGLEEDCQH